MAQRHLDLGKTRKPESPNSSVRNDSNLSLQHLTAIDPHLL